MINKCARARCVLQCVKHRNVCVCVIYTQRSYCVYENRTRGILKRLRRLTCFYFIVIIFEMRTYTRVCISRVLVIGAYVIGEKIKDVKLGNIRCIQKTFKE